MIFFFDVGVLNIFFLFFLLGGGGGGGNWNLSFLIGFKRAGLQNVE